MVQLTIALHGHATPANLNLQNVARVDIAVGQGGPDYPRHEEVFNTPEGALDSYQVEVRRLSHDQLQQWQQQLQQWQEQLQERQQALQQWQEKLQKLEKKQEELQQLRLMQHVEYTKDMKGVKLEKEQLIERATDAEGHRNSDLNKIKKLTRALAREKQQGGRRRH